MPGAGGNTGPLLFIFTGLGRKPANEAINKLIIFTELQKYFCEFYNYIFNYCQYSAFVDRFLQIFEYLISLVLLTHLKSQ